MAVELKPNPVSQLAASNVRIFLEIASAYDHCDAVIREVVDDMKSIFLDDAATEDEKKRAVYTIVEALFPELSAEVAAADAAARRSPEALAREKAMDAEEAAFASNLQRLMQERGLTQEQLGERVGVGQAAISNMLARRCRPQRKTVAKFASALGVAPSELWPAPLD